MSKDSVTFDMQFPLELLSVSDAARELGVSRDTVLRLIRSQELLPQATCGDMAFFVAAYIAAVKPTFTSVRGRTRRAPIVLAKDGAR